MLKPLFIALAPVVLFYNLVIGVQWLWSPHWQLGLGLVLSAAPLLLFLAYILLFRSLARTSQHLWVLQLPALLGGGLCLFYFNQTGLWFLGLVAYAITALYVYWYSDNGRRFSLQLAVGQQLPDFSLKNHDGQTITAERLRAQPAVLLFTRGNWCPLCMAQIDEVVAAYKQLDQLGVQVAILASQPEAQTQALAARFAVPIMFLFDEHQQVGRQLGLVHRHGLPFGFQLFGHQSDQYYPTVIVTDHQGMIIYSDQTSNYRLRPEPADWLKLIKASSQ